MNQTNYWDRKKCANIDNNKTHENLHSFLFLFNYSVLIMSKLYWV